MKTWLRRAGLAALVVLLGGAGGLAAFVWHQPGMAAIGAHPYAGPAPRSARPLYATWLGTTAVLLDDGEHALMIDPFFTRPEGLLRLALNRQVAPDEALIARWLERLRVDRLEAVLVSHSHYDHAMDAGLVARRTGALLVGSRSTANIGRGAGVPESQLRVVEPDAELVAGPFAIRFVPARHAGATGGRPLGDIDAPLVPPARYLDYRQGGTYSILVRHPAGTVLHHGSAGFVPGALAGRHADVAFLGIALVADLPAYLRETVDAVGARRIVPTHWDDFTRGLDEPLRPMPLAVRLDRFFEGVQARPGFEVGFLEPGRRVLLLP